eukprot:COSAG02_NODE_5390_length_4373_cov_2.880440_3_plen_90_part_00
MSSRAHKGLLTWRERCNTVRYTGSTLVRFALRCSAYRRGPYGGLVVHSDLACHEGTWKKRNVQTVLRVSLLYLEGYMGKVATRPPPTMC